MRHLSDRWPKNMFMCKKTDLLCCCHVDRREFKVQDEHVRSIFFQTCCFHISPRGRNVLKLLYRFSSSCHLSCEKQCVELRPREVCFWVIYHRHPGLPACLITPGSTKRQSASGPADHGRVEGGGTVCLHWHLNCPYFPLQIQWLNCLQNVFSI